jgi:nucleoside-diphosphate kinase
MNSKVKGGFDVELERTFVMLKPDAVQRGLIGEIILRLERCGLKLIAMKFMQIPDELAKKHYAEHEGKPFYDKLVTYITSGPVVPMVWEGANAVDYVRKILGATDPQNSAPGTIRADYGQEIGRNIIHGSDSLASAEREINLFFPESDFVSYTKIDESWVHE